MTYCSETSFFAGAAGVGVKVEAADESVWECCARCAGQTKKATEVALFLPSLRRQRWQARS